MQVIVARHCESTGNAMRKVQGASDGSVLTEKGIAQAMRLVRDLKRHPIAMVYTSDLRRALQTATIIAHVIGCGMKIDARLRECHFGSLEGLTYEEFAASCGPQNLRRAPDPLGYDFSPWGGEKAKDVIDRHEQMIQSVADIHRTDEICVVGHGRSLRTFLLSRSLPYEELEQGTYVKFHT